MICRFLTFFREPRDSLSHMTWKACGMRESGAQRRHRRWVNVMFGKRHIYVLIEEI